MDFGACQPAGRAHGGHQAAGAASGPGRRRITGGQVDAVGALELVPRKRIVAARPDPVAENGDRALRVRVGVHERAPLRPRPPGGFDPNPEPLQRPLRPPTELVVAERGQEQALARESRELDRGDRAPAAHLLPGLLRVDDLARGRHAFDPRELAPFDVPDHG